MCKRADLEGSGFQRASSDSANVIYHLHDEENTFILISERTSSEGRLSSRGSLADNLIAYAERKCAWSTCNPDLNKQRMNGF